MTAEAILGLVAQGLQMLPTLIQAGEDVISRIEQIGSVAKSGSDGTLTAEQIATYRAQLDADLADFNTPMA